MSVVLPDPAVAPRPPDTPLLLGVWRVGWRVPLLLLHLLDGVLIAVAWRLLHPGVRWAPVPVGLSSAWHRLLLRCLGIRVECNGTRYRGAGLVVANHISWADISVLASLGQQGFVSKAEVAAWPVIGLLARSVGTVFIRRGKAGATRGALTEIRDRLRRGEQLVVFPEGTTSDGAAVQPFYPLLLRPVAETRAAALPLAISYPSAGLGADPRAPYIGDDSLGGSLWRLLWGGPMRCRVNWLAPIGGGERGDSRCLADTLQRVISAELQAPALRRSA